MRYRLLYNSSVGDWSPEAEEVGFLWHVQSASAEIERLARLLDDFRFLRPAASRRLRPTHLKKVIEEALAVEMAGLSVSAIAADLDLQPYRRWCLVAIKWEKRVYLFKNAEEAMPGGGRLTICGRVREQEKVAVVEASDNRHRRARGSWRRSIVHDDWTGRIRLRFADRRADYCVPRRAHTRIPERAPGTTFEILLPLSPTFMIPSSTVNE
jgi:hypothetical protein